MEHVNNIYTIGHSGTTDAGPDKVKAWAKQIERAGYKLWNPRKFKKTDYYKPSDAFFAFASAIVALYVAFIVSGSMVLLSGSLVGNTSLASGFGAFLADSGIWMANIAGWSAGVGAAVYVGEKALKYDPPKQKALENAKNLIESKLYVELNALSKDIVLGKKDLTTIRSHLDNIVNNVRDSIPKNSINRDKLNDAFVSILGEYNIKYNNAGNIDTATFTDNFKMKPVDSGVTLQALYDNVEKAYNIANNKEEAAALGADVGQKIKFTLLQKFLENNKNLKDDTILDLGDKTLQCVRYDDVDTAFNSLSSRSINKQFLHDDLVKAIKKTEESISPSAELKDGLNLDTAERSRRRSRDAGGRS